MNNVTLSGRFHHGHGLWRRCGGRILEPTIFKLLTVTRGHAIFHTKIDNRQSTEMIYVTGTRPSSHPSLLWLLLIRPLYFLLRFHTRNYILPSTDPVFRSSYYNPLTLTRTQKKPQHPKIALRKTRVLN